MVQSPRSAPITANNLILTNHSGSVILGNAANRIGRLVFATVAEDFALATANAMTIGDFVTAGTSFQWASGEA